MTKVLFLAYYFPPAGGAGVQRSLKFVQYLPADGYLPVVVTAPQRPDDRWTPLDESLMASIPAGVSVYTVKGNPPAAGKGRKRLEKWLGLPARFSRWWIDSATELALQVARDEALIFATMSPFESGEAARRLSGRLGIPWVADLRDPWALDEMQVYCSWLHRKVELRRMEKLLSTAALVVMNTPEASTALKAAFPALADKPVATIPNGFDRADFSDEPAPRRDRKFRIVHTGYFHTGSGLQLEKRSFYRLLGGAEPGVHILTRSATVLLQALDRWCERRPEVKRDLDIVFAGETTEEDRSVASASAAADLVRFPGYLSHSESVATVRTADLLFLPMPDLPPGRRSRIVPGKTYEYMAAARPILGAVPEGDARDFLVSSGTGLICAPGDVDGMSRLLEQAYSNWKTGGSGQHYNRVFVEQFERRNLTHLLAAAFDTVLHS